MDIENEAEGLDQYVNRSRRIRDRLVKNIVSAQNISQRPCTSAKGPASQLKAPALQPPAPAPQPQALRVSHRPLHLSHRPLHLSQRPCTSATGPCTSATGPCTSAIGPCASATRPCASATGPCASATGPCASPRGSRRQQVSRRRSKGIRIQQMKRQVALLQQLLDLQIQQQNLQCAFTPRPLPNISTPPSTGRSIFGMVGTPSPLWFLLFYQ